MKPDREQYRKACNKLLGQSSRADMQLLVASDLQKQGHGGGEGYKPLDLAVCDFLGSELPEGSLPLPHLWFGVRV